MTHSKKWQRVLTALAEGRSFNRFEAERELSDHCLHSTIATIQSKGVPVARRYDIVPGFRGFPTKCCRYWLDPKDLATAQTLLAACDRHTPAVAACDSMKEFDALFADSNLLSDLDAMLAGFDPVKELDTLLAHVWDESGQEELNVLCEVA
jgi:hypothetical protein